MIASVLQLNRADIKALKIKDAYSLHRVVYSLYEDVRTSAEKSASVASGILYVDKGGDWQSRKILMLSNRQPRQPDYGQLLSKPITEAFLQYDDYRFEITLNPSKRDKASGKTIAIRTHQAISQWFTAKVQRSHGFSINPHHLQINRSVVQCFEKQGFKVTQGCVTLTGILKVTDRARFINSFQQGIGRGRAFGLGLLQVVPITPC